MADYPDIHLRYFNVRGRAQFIRGLLTCRDVPFHDERISLGSDRSVWLETRQDRAITGPFQKLPTLQWGDVMVGEVLVIANFLQRKLGDAARLGESRGLQHEMLASSAFLDLLTPCINLIWADFFHPGADVAKTTQGVRGKLELHLATVNRTLEEWRYLDDVADRPVMIADAILWEALDVVRETFAGDLDIRGYAALAGFYEDCPGRGAFRALLDDNPVTITARPGEADALAAIRA